MSISEIVPKKPAPKQKKPRVVPPENVLNELVQEKIIAKLHAKAFSDAVAAQADKHGLSKSALRRYITARESDKLEETRTETEDLERLIG